MLYLLYEATERKNAMPLKTEFHPVDVPAKPGVYVYRDRFGVVIYVGKARNLRKRMSSYFQPSRLKTAEPKLRSLINSIHSWSYEVVRSEDEALILESRLIKAYAPHYNILMRDDKRYLLLKIDWNEKFPTLTLARIEKPGNFQYFGPFPKGSALKMTLDFLLAHFGLRACRDSEPNEETRKHCLKRIINDCCAPCIGKVTVEEYRQRLEAALAVLKGDIAGLQTELEEKMKTAAAAMDFEKAARYRDISANLEAVFGRKNRKFENPELPDSDPGMLAVQDLADKLGLQNLPRHVIGFDISNILGKLAVASLVVMRDGKPDRSSYRRFRIKTVDQSNDFAMMKEVIMRHFTRLMENEAPFPDLVMVDGGKGQLSSAIAGLIEIGAPPLPILGLAEKNEEIYLPGQSDPVILSRHDPALKMLQSLRDEAHRFAITFHRELRHRQIERSLLDDIPGVGSKRKIELLRKFGSIAALRKSTPEEIAEKVPGLGLSLAEKIHETITAAKKTVS